MHDTALISGSLFAQCYVKRGMKVLDIGGQDINGSLRKPFEDVGAEYICVDIEAGKNVDIVVKPGESLPFETGSIDIIISTSCFEHDPCFWMSFIEMCRILKIDGFIYVNAPSNGYYHNYPIDNWRFYSDAGQALAFWASKTINGECYPVEVVETFHILPINDIWIDFVCIWKRTNNRTDNIILSNDIINNFGLLKSALLSNNVKIRNKL